MKEFEVSIDFTMSKTLVVKAESEEQAKSIVREKLNRNVYDYTNGFSHCVGYEIISVL